MDSLYKNGTWELVNKPKDQKLVSCKWIYKIKEGVKPGEGPRYKARLVAKGFTQKAGVDYNEIFSPVVKHVSIRVILSLVASLDLELEQMDVKTAFLHGNLEEKIYMAQPKGYEVKGQEDKACLLKRSLYGLKQSPRQWYKRFDEYIVGSGFSRSPYDSCVYHREYDRGKFVYLLLYVDDMLIACESKSQIEETKQLLMREFEMKDLGKARKILGMEIHRNRAEKVLTLSQSSYIEKVLKNYGMGECKPVTTPLAAHFNLSKKDCPQTDEEEEYMSKVPYANTVGSLMYLMVCTRPDIAYAVSVVSRYMANPGKNHWAALKWVLRYLAGTKKLGLKFENHAEKENMVSGYVDSDYAKDKDNGRSITGYVFSVMGNMVSWKSQLQHVVALSTTEAEFISLTEGVKESLWLKGMVADLGIKLDGVEVNCDNEGAVQLSKNSVFHERTKHINVKMFWIRDVVNSKEVVVKWVGTDINPADVMTKALPGAKFTFCFNSLSLG